MAKWNKNKSKGKTKLSSGASSWLDDSGIDSGLQTDFEQGSEIDFIPAYEEDEEVDRKIKSNIKGLPIIGRFNKVIQYTLASVGIALSGTIFLGGFWYSHELLMQVQSQKASVNEIGILLNKVQNNTVFFAALNSKSLKNLKDSESTIDRDFSFLRESDLQESKNLDILYANWNNVKQSTNIVVSSTDLLNSVKENIGIVNAGINNQSNTILGLLNTMSQMSSVSPSQISYLAQINGILQRINNNLYLLGNESANYPTILANISSDNALLPKALSALIDGRLGVLTANVKESLSGIYNKYLVSSSNITSAVQKLDLISRNISMNKSLNMNYDNYVSALSTDVNELMDLIKFYQKIVWLFAILTGLFVSLLMAINIRESKKSLLSEKLQKERMDVEIKKILEDLNLILQGNISHRVQNKPGKLLTLSDFINSVLDKISEEFENQLGIVKSLKLNQKSYESENTEIVSNLSAQDDNLTNVIKDMQVLNLSFTNVKKSMIAVNRLIDNYEKEFKKGSLSLPNYTMHTTEAKKKVNEVETRITRLKGSIEEMMDITNDLLLISEKMEVLSFHATVQVAKKERTNEGFNVVAEDIGKLAKKMQESSKSIHTLTNSTNSDIRSTLGSLDEINSHLLDLFSVMTKIETNITSSEELKDNIKKLNVDTTENSEKVDETAKNILENFQSVINKNESTGKLTDEFKNINKSNNALLTRLSQNISLMIKKESKE